LAFTLVFIYFVRQRTALEVLHERLEAVRAEREG
jgi:hypothetical protein